MMPSAIAPGGYVDIAFYATLFLSRSVGSLADFSTPKETTMKTRMKRGHKRGHRK
jgi:hypothetical protein